MLIEAESPSKRKLSPLESKAVKGGVWTLVAYGVGQSVRLGNSLVLTRLLVPDAFGLMALVSTLIMGINLLSDIGLGEGVVQSPRGDDEVFLNTAWTVQILRGVAIWVASALLAYPISRIYQEPRLTALIPTFALMVVFSGLCSTNLLSMQRDINVGRVYLIEFGVQLVQLAVTAVWALKFPSVWALVGGTLVSTVFRMVVSHWHRVVPGIRNRLAWDRDSLRGLVHFGRWILVGTAAFFFASQADRLILGKLVSFKMLGVYGVAFTLSDLPRQVILTFCSRVGYPFIAKMRDLPREQFRSVFLKYRFYVLIFGAVALAVVVFGGGPLVMVLYDRRYHDASWMIPILALGLWHTLLYSTIKPALYTVGHTSYHAVGNILYLVMIATTLPIGFRYYGMAGVVVAVAAGDLPLYVLNVAGASQQRVACWRQDLLCTGIFASLLAVGLVIQHMVA